MSMMEAVRPEVSENSTRDHEIEDGYHFIRFFMSSEEENEIHDYHDEKTVDVVGLPANEI